jgi:hypothetical protein
MGFVDFLKAFDSITRKSIWRALQRRKVPIKIINLNKSAYSNFSYRVHHKGRLSESLVVSSGVRQGCILSPLLFFIVLDDLMEMVNKRCPSGIQWGLTNKLTDIEYADDICILCQRAGDMQDKLATLAEEGQKVGLKINTNKTNN